VEAPRCLDCGHYVQHHQSYPYLDGVLCPTRVCGVWCSCALNIDQAIAAREAAAKAEALREAADDMPFGYSHAAALLRELADREAT
jgi:hypothetical protein